jgi:hypothetical protein
MSAIKTRAKSDGLRLLRAIDSTQAHGQGGVRTDPNRAAHDAGLEVGDVGSDRYHRAWVTSAGRARWWGTSTRRPGRAPGNTTATRRTSSPGRV